MSNRPGEDRNTPGGLGDRGGQRDATNDNARQGGATGTRSRSNRGFASMDRSKQKEIASKGGKAAHAKGTAHEFDSSEAREAGRKGGVAVSRNREHMAAIGRRGGEARGHSRTRASVHANTGASDALSGSYQNTRAGSNGADRQVTLDNGNEGVTANPQGNRGGNASLGGERRPNALDSTNSSTRGETFGNH
jgi:uncharacterized protein